MVHYLPVGLVVVDHESPEPIEVGMRAGASFGSAERVSKGISNQKVLPEPGSLSTPI